MRRDVARRRAALDIFLIGNINTGPRRGAVEWPHVTRGQVPMNATMTQMDTPETLAYETNPAGGVSKAARWTGRVLSALPALLLIFSAVMKFMKPPEVVEGMVKLGWPERYTLGLGILELGCTLIYLIPQTAVLGAILLTGYLGGAMATHVRLGEPVYTHIVLGVVIWLGVFLRDRRLRALIPLRRL